MIVEEPTPDYVAGKVSWSKLACFSRCQKLFFWRYIMKRREPMSWALLFGRGAHEGMEADAYAKLRGDKLSVRQVLDAAVEGFKAERTKEGMTDKEAPTDNFADEHLTQLEVFEKTGERARIQPRPGSVEGAFEIDVLVGTPQEGLTPAKVEGFVDVVSDSEAGPVVVDYKTGSRPVSAKEAAGHLQLALEAIGGGVGSARIVSFVRRYKQKPTAKVTPDVVIDDVRRGRVLQYVADTIHAIRKCIKNGFYAKCSPVSTTCAGCAFFEECHGRERPTALHKFVQVEKIQPVGTLPPAKWRESVAGRKERERTTTA